MTLIIICLLRYLERLGGSRKYASLLVVLSTLTTLLLFASLVLGASYIVDMDATNNEGIGGFVGPHAVLFALLTIVVAEVPAVHSFSFLGVQFSERLFTYLLAYQLISNRFGPSLLQAIIGIAVGMLYRRNFLGLSTWRIPNAVSKPFSSIFGPILDSKPDAALPRPNANVQRTQAVPQVVQQAPIGAPQVPRRPVEDRRVQQLVAMVPL